MSNLNMQDILRASFGEVNNEVRVSFKKTVLIRSYETEVVEVESSIKLDREIDGAARQLVCSIAQAQVEYEAYGQLFYKGLVSKEETTSRKTQLERGVAEAVYRYEQATGKSADDVIGIVSKTE